MTREQIIGERRSLDLGLQGLPDGALGMLDRFGARMAIAPGSQAKHQAWAGGYLDHVDECFAYAAAWHGAADFLRHVDFSLDDALLVLWLHDIEKVFKYTAPVRDDVAYEKMLERDSSWEFAVRVAKDFWIDLTDAQVNALRYIHGEGSAHHPTERRMGPLATLCHMADIWSARGAYDEPRKSGYLEPPMALRVS